MYIIGDKWLNNKESDYMAVTVDIFNPQVSVVAKGLEGKVLFVYSGNNRGKTYVASHLSRPFFILCESGLNALAGIKYNRVNNWADFKKLVNQFTNKKTVDAAKALYDTIVIDEVYASSIFCQDYVCKVYGNGALTLADSPDPRKNLWKIYEQEYFRTINQLLSCGYTVMFIGHEQEKDGYIMPKGDRRMVQPILDNSDFVIYLTSNGVDEDGKIQLSTAHFAETDRFFARSRFTECVTEITPYTAENLEKAIKDAIEAEERKSGIAAVDYKEQQAMNTSVELDFEQLMDDIQKLGEKINEAGHFDDLVEIIEKTLGAGAKVSECTKKQVEALSIIKDDLQDYADELGI